MMHTLPQASWRSRSAGDRRALRAGGGCFCDCVRLVFSQGELMTEGGWAGAKVTPASEEA